MLTALNRRTASFHCANPLLGGVLENTCRITLDFPSSYKSSDNMLTSAAENTSSRSEITGRDILMIESTLLQQRTPPAAVKLQVEAY